MRKDSQGPLIAQCLAIVALIIALLPINPYGYYVLLRFVICGICAYLAVTAYQRSKLNWVWILGGLAVLYNPLIPVHLNREVWSGVNIVTIVLIALTMWRFRRKSERPQEPVTLPPAREQGEYDFDASGYVFDAATRTLRGPDGFVYRVLSASRSGPDKSTFSVEAPTGAVFKITLRGLVVTPDTEQSIPIDNPVIRECKRCGKMKITQSVFFIENISYFFGRQERIFQGYVCFSCMTKTFAIFETRTLLGTWWGIIGMIAGPGYLLENLIEYLKHSYRFARSK